MLVDCENGEWDWGEERSKALGARLWRAITSAQITPRNNKYFTTSICHHTTSITLALTIVTLVYFLSFFYTSNSRKQRLRTNCGDVYSRIFFLFNILYFFLTYLFSTILTINHLRILKNTNWKIAKPSESNWHILDSIAKITISSQKLFFFYIYTNLVSFIWLQASFPGSGGESLLADCNQLFPRLPLPWQEKSDRKDDETKLIVVINLISVVSRIIPTHQIQCTCVFTKAQVNLLNFWWWFGKRFLFKRRNKSLAPLSGYKVPTKTSTKISLDEPVSLFSYVGSRQ